MAAKGALSGGGMNRGTISSMVAMLAAAAFGNNSALKIEYEKDAAHKPQVAKFAGMAPRDIARYRKSTGHPKRRRNLQHCARLAKVRRRSS